jgi:hypothetical protein
MADSGRGAQCLGPGQLRAAHAGYRAVVRRAPSRRHAPPSPGTGGSASASDPADGCAPPPHGGRSVQTGRGPPASPSPTSSRISNNQIYLGAFRLAGGFCAPECTKSSTEPKSSRTLTPHSARAPRHAQGPANRSGVPCPAFTVPGSVLSGACCTGSTKQSMRSSFRTSSTARPPTVAGRPVSACWIMA